MTPRQIVTLTMRPGSGDPRTLIVGAILEFVREDHEVLLAKVVSYDHAAGVLRVEPVERDALQ